MIAMDFVLCAPRIARMRNIGCRAHKRF